VATWVSARNHRGGRGRELTLKEKEYERDNFCATSFLKGDWGRTGGGPFFRFSKEPGGSSRQPRLCMGWRLVSFGKKIGILAPKLRMLRA